MQGGALSINIQAIQRLPKQVSNSATLQVLWDPSVVLMPGSYPEILIVSLVCSLGIGFFS